MKISCIIPALNEAENIVTAVERAWQAGAAELIVADGGSTDDTAALARDAGAQVLESPRGRAQQQNAGAAVASGAALLFLHADTWLPPGGVEQIARALANEQTLCGAFRQQIEADGRMYRWLERGNAWRVRWRGIPYGDQGIFVRRGAFERAGGFPDVRFLEDVLFMRNFRRRSWPVLLPGPLHVSARRWQRHGIMQQTLRNGLLLAAARLGVHPDRLAAFYSPHYGPDQLARPGEKSASS